MKAAIITVPGRDHYLKPLIEVIEPEVESLKLYIDSERRGHWFNLHRCMEEMLREAAPDEPTLITCDDVITIPGWRRYWEEIHSRAQNSIYTFMSRQRHLFKPENIARGYVTSCQPKGFYDHAVIYINRPTLVGDALDWFEREGHARIHPRRHKWLDIIIGCYLRMNGIPWTLTTPTLFNHIGARSTLGNDIGESVNYIGNDTGNK